MHWRKFEPENPENPQDNFGQFHNDLLDEFERSFKTIRKEYFLNDVVNLLIGKAYELLEETPDETEYRTGYMTAVTAYFAQKDPYKVYYNTKLFSTELQEIIAKQIQIISIISPETVIEAI